MATDPVHPQPLPPPDALGHDEGQALDLTPVTTRDALAAQEDRHKQPPSPPSPIIRPPTPGGGPLSSHPATPEQTASRFAPPPPTELDGAELEPPKADSVTASTPHDHQSSFEKSVLQELGLKGINANTPSPTNGQKSEDVQGTESLHHFLDQSRITPPLYDTNKPAKHIDVTAAAAAIPAPSVTPIKTNIPARKPSTPASTTANAPSISRRNSTSVRKLLSFSSLRSSFSSSRVSLQNTQQGQSPSTAQRPDFSTGSPTHRHRPRPASPSDTTLLPGSPTAGFQSNFTTTISGGPPERTTSRLGNRSDYFGLGKDKHLSRSLTTSRLGHRNDSGGGGGDDGQPNEPDRTPPHLRKRRSGNWIRRASGMLNFDEGERAKLRDAEEKEGSEVDGWRSGWGSSGRKGRHGGGHTGRPRRDSHRPGDLPVLPELQGIGGQELDGWGQDIFAGIKAA